jgi:hypothetical protein
MSWPDVFPTFSEEQFDDYYETATPAEKAELEEWYGVEKILNPQPDAREIVSLSLFWKPVESGTPDYPAPTLEILQNAVELGYADRFNPWDHYVAPILDHTPEILAQNPDLSIRVYLAKDLEFLAEDLTRAGCEVHLMKSSSIKQAPGSLWRFLPLSEEGKLVTVTDTDRLPAIEHDLARTRMMAQTEVGTWRVPVPNDLTDDFRVCYIPFIACQFGVKGGLLEVDDLLKAFTWNCLHNKVDPSVILPNCGPLPMLRHTWPDYCFDEFFLAVAAYPRLAQDGMMTFIPGNGSSQLMTLDIEYTTWGNPASEVIYFPSGSCCGQDDSTKSESQPLPESAPKFCENPKVAFLISSGSEMLHQTPWDEYLRQSDDSAQLFQASEDSPAESDLALIRSQIAQLKEALQSEKWTHFIFLPSDAIPTRSAAQLLRSLRLDPRSRMTLRSWEDERKTNVLRAQLVENLGQIRKELAHFHSPWVCLSREDALLLTSEDLTPNFESCQSPAECFYATALAALGRPPLQNVANRTLTWTSRDNDFRTQKAGKIAPDLAAQIAECGSFFSAGFHAESDIADYQLHVPS